MESRKVIKIRGSLYMCIPSSIAEALNIERGDRCQCLLLPNYGLLVRKEGSGERFPAPLEAIGSLQQAADNIFHELRRKARGLERQFSFTLAERLFSEVFRYVRKIPGQQMIMDEDVRKELPNVEGEKISEKEE